VLTGNAATAGTKGTGGAGSRKTGTGAAETGRLANARFTGQVAVANAAGQRTITITGRTVAAPAQHFVTVLHGVPAGQGTSSVTGTASLLGDS
jgi:hypothetical protein